MLYFIFLLTRNGEGGAQDQLNEKLKAARCAMVERIAKTLHIVMRLLAYHEASLRAGGDFPPSKND
jgi:hypothetical protein